MLVLPDYQKVQHSLHSYSDGVALLIAVLREDI